MKPLFVIPILTSILIGTSAYASSDQEIISFAKEICDEISDEGTIRREQIEGSINAKVTGLARLLGGSAGADGKLIIDETEYKGLPYEELPAQMIDARSCRKDLAIMLIRERQELENKKTLPPQKNMGDEEAITQLEIDIYRLELKFSALNQKIIMREQELAKRNEIIEFLSNERDQATAQGKTTVANRFAEQLKQTQRNWEILPYSQDEIDERDALKFELNKKKELLRMYSEEATQ